MNDVYLDIKHLYKKYQSTIIFENDTITCKRGVTLLAGPNGAGKSTLIKLILGLIGPDSGEIALYGNTVVKGVLDNQLKRKIGLQLQNDSFLKSVKVKEYIELYSQVYGSTSSKYDIEKIKNILGVNRLFNKYAFNLSGGEKKKLSLFLALIGDKDLIILDEPTAGIDVEIKVKIIEVLNYLRTQGVDILVSSHDLEDFFENCDNLLIINRGKVFEGNVKEFLDKFKNLVKVKSTPNLAQKTNKASVDIFGSSYLLLSEEDCKESQKELIFPLTIKDYYFLAISEEI